jgi:parvulin-like peptidyl-prolyl isomerase
MKKIIFALALTLSTGSLSAAQVIEAIVIRVGDRIVTRTQYERRLRDGYTEIEQTAPADQQAAKRQQLRETLLNDMISELLIKDRADRLGLTVSTEEIAEATTRLKQQYNISSDAQFEQSLRESGMSRADMEVRLRDTIITNKVFSRELRGRNEVTDRELRERYDREKDHYRLPERAHLREIVVLRPEGETRIAEARTKAAELAQSARSANANFANLAKTLSESGSRDKGGDLGEVAKGELLPDLDRAVFNAPAGTVVGPIESKSAWHIILVEQRLPSEVPAFESVKDRLRKDASEETFQRDYKAYIERLRKEAFIQVHDEHVPKA